MRFGLFGILFLFTPHAVFAAIPLHIEQPSILELTELTSITEEQFLYGQLDNFPHTFEVVVDEATELFVELQNFNDGGDKSTLSAIIVRLIPETGRVAEVARLEGKALVWESFYNPVIVDRLWRGPSYRGTLEPGLYRIEVHTPGNLEKYILRIGTESPVLHPSYRALIGRLAEFTTFSGRSRVVLLFSPYLYGPMLVFGACVGVIFIWRKRKGSRSDMV